MDFMDDLECFLPDESTWQTNPYKGFIQLSQDSAQSQAKYEAKFNLYRLRQNCRMKKKTPTQIA